MLHNISYISLRRRSGWWKQDLGFLERLWLWDKEGKHIDYFQNIKSQVDQSLKRCTQSSIHFWIPSYLALMKKWKYWDSNKQSKHVHFQSEIGKNRWCRRGGLQFRQKESEWYERRHRTWIWEIIDKLKRCTETEDEVNLFTILAVSCFLFLSRLLSPSAFYFYSSVSAFLFVCLFVLALDLCSVFLFHCSFLFQKSSASRLFAGLFFSLSMKVDFMVVSLYCESFQYKLCDIYSPLLEYISVQVMSDQPSTFIGVWHHACDPDTFRLVCMCVIFVTCSLKFMPTWES